MKVNGIPIDKNLYNKCILFKERIGRGRDCLVLCDGSEGDGKSALAGGICKIMSFLLEREFNVNNVFFNMEEMIKFATTTENKIIMWDEAALGGLRKQWNNKMQIKLIQLLMVARKKRHFFIFNVPRVKRLSEDLIERAIALVHVYSPDEIELGRFAYYRRGSFMTMYEKWKSSKKLLYSKFYSFNGRFSDYIHKYKVVDPKEYERKKDQAILSLNEELDSPKKNAAKDVAYNKMREYILSLPMTDYKREKETGISGRTFQRWRKEIKDAQNEEDWVDVSVTMPIKKQINSIVKSGEDNLIAPVPKV